MTVAVNATGTIEMVSEIDQKGAARRMNVDVSFRGSGHPALVRALLQFELSFGDLPDFLAGKGLSLHVVQTDPPTVAQDAQ